MASKIHQVISNRRKPQHEIDRENYEKEMTMHINKAICKEEGATKEKHVRTILMGTFKDSSCRLFWLVATKLPLQGHPIVCWKFLHVVHKLLRDGHQSCLSETLGYRTLLSELSKLWGHLKEGYGRPIQGFSRLIVSKLKFHQKYPQLPGTISLNAERIANITQNAIDSYFELSVDLLDYLDELLNFQSAVFNSLDRSKANSMTLHGQCKLSPLIQCLQDSASLYDALVNILFRLHSQLPADTLVGHTERFITSFKQLQTFYQTCSNLQYYRNLVTVPLLPDQPPNFLLAGGLSNHTAPVVSTVSPTDDEDDYDDKDNPANWVPELATMREDPVPVLQEVSPLLDLMEPSTNGQMFSDNADFENGLLQQQQQQQQQQLQHQEEQWMSRIVELERRIDELTRERQDLLKKVESASAQIKELESYQNKFTKLKEIYHKLREEHIALLRSHSSSNKQNDSLSRQLEDSQRQVNEHKNQLAHLHDLQHLQHNNSSVSNEAELLDAKRRLDELTGVVASSDNEKLEMNNKLTELQSRVDELTQDKFSLTESLRLADERSQDQDRQLIAAACQSGIELIKESLDDDDPSLIMCRSNADYLLGRIDVLMSQVESLEDSCHKYLTDPLLSLHAVVNHIHTFSAATKDTVIQGIIVSNAAPHIDLTLGHDAASLHDNLMKLQSLSKLTAEESSTFLSNLTSGWDEETLMGHCASLFNHLSGLRALAELLRPQVKDVQSEDIGEQVECEMRSISEAVEAAESRVRQLIQKAQDDLTGVQLEVNVEVLESCTTLMLAVKQLVTRSGHLQREIVAEGRGAASSAEFYQKHSRWTEGLLSAAKTVGLAATTLCDAADKLVSSGGCKFEELMVCAQEIVASTAQLVVASRVKANPKSYLLQQLTDASKNVTQATGAVVAQARSASDRVQDAQATDFSNLSLTQTKRQEMQSQVRVLELESELAKERVTLGELRKLHYQMVGETEDETNGGVS